ncbi:hypothetical protein CYMTET_10645 [Cymbomonas tetramitiformis]|uniref:Uncharacterized protein n=1 Tax=Cymbomonas tetramitiformis TaxID=36881 RepID=A0AAE0LE95_9CHLO|nr:hypothetical protein CYMTET_10645 [Cymbomonas tetramitiformis]
MLVVMRSQRWWACMARRRRCARDGGDTEAFDVSAYGFAGGGAVDAPADGMERKLAEIDFREARRHDGYSTSSTSPSTASRR